MTRIVANALSVDLGRPSSSNHGPLQHHERGVRIESAQVIRVARHNGLSRSACANDDVRIGNIFRARSGQEQAYAGGVGTIK